MNPNNTASVPVEESEIAISDDFVSQIHEDCQLPSELLSITREISPGNVISYFEINPRGFSTS